MAQHVDNAPEPERNHAHDGQDTKDFENHHGPSVAPSLWPFWPTEVQCGGGSEAHRDVASTCSRSGDGKPKNGHEQDERTAATQDDQHGV
jgi:hypothetical protein